MKENANRTEKPILLLIKAFLFFLLESKAASIKKLETIALIFAVDKRKPTTIFIQSLTNSNNS